MSQVLFPKLATSNVFLKSSKVCHRHFPKSLHKFVFQKLSQALFKLRLREQLETSQGEVQRLDHRVTELATQVTGPFLILSMSDSRLPAPIPPTKRSTRPIVFTCCSPGGVVHERAPASRVCVAGGEKRASGVDRRAREP